MTSNSNYKPTENKREEFRKYLEKTGVMDALTKVLVSLYEEPDKTDNALEYVCNKLSSQIDGVTIESLKVQLEEAQQKIAALQQENAALKGEDVPPADEPSPANVVEDEAPAEEVPPPDAE